MGPISAFAGSFSRAQSPRGGRGRTNVFGREVGLVEVPRVGHESSVDG